MAGRQSMTARAGLAPELPRTVADRIQIQQALMNLMLNGIEAIQDSGGELSVNSARSGDGGAVHVPAKDRGIGLPAEPGRVFEPSWTTKRRGAGMGLSRSRGTIASPGSRPWAALDAEGGVTFQRRNISNARLAGSWRLWAGWRTATSPT